MHTMKKIGLLLPILLLSLAINTVAQDYVELDEDIINPTPITQVSTDYEADCEAAADNAGIDDEQRDEYIDSCQDDPSMFLFEDE